MPGRELLQRLPMAMLLLDAGGHAVWVNDRFSQMFDPAALDLTSLAGGDCPAAPRKRSLVARDGTTSELLVHCVPMPESRLLLLDNTPGSVDAVVLRDLQLRVTELERDSLTDRLTGAWNRRYRCHVTGVDLTRELCDVAVDLNRRVGLAGQVEIHCADAQQLPFDDAGFDVVWTQHVSMNIADKARLFAEMRRVARAGARLAFFDILAGPHQPIHFPVPWAGDESVSFLATFDETRDLLASNGFVVRTWEDVTPDAIEFYARLSQVPAAAPSPLGLQLVIDDMPGKLGNLRRNAEEDRIRVVRCVADTA